MRTDLDHLPPPKQRELERVVQILFEEFGDATAIATSTWKKQARILKVILYGSYAHFHTWVLTPDQLAAFIADACGKVAGVLRSTICRPGPGAYLHDE